MKPILESTDQLIEEFNLGNLTKVFDLIKEPFKELIEAWKYQPIRVNIATFNRVFHNIGPLPSVKSKYDYIDNEYLRDMISEVSKLTSGIKDETKALQDMISLIKRNVKYDIEAIKSFAVKDVDLVNSVENNPMHTWLKDQISKLDANPTLIDHLNALLSFIKDNQGPLERAAIITLLMLIVLIALTYGIKKEYQKLKG